MLKTVQAMRYVTPLREGGSLPAVIEADDGEMYVMKFHGAGQGHKALIAEIIAGELARALGLLIPEQVFIHLDEKLGPSEPDAEIQDLLNASVGLNLGMRFLPNALPFNELIDPKPSPKLASEIVWFDAFVTNVDRTPRNVNMLLHQNQLWLIDHGASLYFHHDWQNYMDRSLSKFPLIKDHVMLKFATQLAEADSVFTSMITQSLVDKILAIIPDSWLTRESPFSNPVVHREAYSEFLLSRINSSETFVNEAENARDALL
ncbi:MAG: aminotransferase class I and II [Candidatus Marinimicrobia bacterium]|nr:aminotransferase class I and II [Candidatus Neomarinimicrobiota bacterium]